MSRARLALKMRALSVALSLKADVLDPADLAALERAAGWADPEDTMARAALGFCARVMEARADRARQVALADDLLKWIELENLPDVSGLNRKDVHG